MKRKYRILMPLFFSILICGCKKNAIQEISKPIGSGAFIKYFNFAVNSPTVNFYADNTKVSASLSTTGVESPTTGVAYSAAYPASNAYSLIAAGTYEFKAKIPSTASADADLAITSIKKQVENGKSYSLYTCGLYDSSTKKTDVFIIDDASPLIDNSAAYVRFVNSSYNTNPINLTFRHKTTLGETVVATNVAYKSASPFQKMPAGVYDLILNYPNDSKDMVVKKDVNIINANVYTFSLRGDITASPTTGNKPFIERTFNR